MNYRVDWQAFSMAEALAYLDTHSIDEPGRPADPAPDPMPVPRVGARARWHDHIILTFIDRPPRVYTPLGRRAENEDRILWRLCTAWGLLDRYHRAMVTP